MRAEHPKANIETAVETGLNDLDSRLSALEHMKRQVELDMVQAAWTLRRLPDREQAIMMKASAAKWPEMQKDRQQDYSADESVFETRLRARLTSAEIDHMQPTLDVLLKLPDLADRALLFWVAWHQQGETYERLPWGRVRGTLAAAGFGKYAAAHRTTLRRNYDAAVGLIARHQLNLQALVG